MDKQYKKRVLWITEASFMATGFSVLSHEILQRLYKTEKFEIAELGSYSRTSDPRAMQIPWKFYGAMPEESDQFAINKYNSSQFGQFGSAIFEQVCLDFKPDIVVDVRDRWMSSEWLLESPFRKYVKYILMPTVDGEPQRRPWLEDYEQCDVVLTYSEYGKNVLEREAPNRVKVSGVVRPGVNHEIFKPMDKRKVREFLGLPQDIFITMTVMRNQKRKLYPDLMDAFDMYLKHCIKNNNKELAQKSFLYLHTSYPDVGFDISKCLLERGLGHKVYVTYVCQACKAFYSDFFQTEITTCKKCGALAAHMPNTQNGVTRHDLTVINNAADAYVQYSICEGFGMPVAEAKACGVSAFAVDYTATSEQVNTYGCFPIEIERFFYESVMETEQRRALPRNEDLVRKLYKFFTLNPEERRKMSEAVRKDASENYSFDRAAKVFENAIDDVEILDRSKTWYSYVPKLLDVNPKIPQVRSNAELIDWCFINIMKRPDLITSHKRNEMLRSLNVGYTTGGRTGQTERIDAQKVVQNFVEIAKNNNFWETIKIQGNNNKKEKLTWEIL